MAQGFEALPWDELLGGVRFAYGGCLGGAADAACLEAMAHCWLRADRGAGDQGGDCGAGGGGGGGEDGGGGGGGTTARLLAVAEAASDARRLCVPVVGVNQRTVAVLELSYQHGAPPTFEHACVRRLTRAVGAAVLRAHF